MLTIMRIEDEFGKYVGTAVVDDLRLRRVSHYLAGQTGHHPEPVCRVIRVWNDYDETGAEMLAEGFIEGFGHHKEPLVVRGSLTGGALPYVNGAEKEPADDMQSLVSSMDESQIDVTSPPPWEQGFKWDGGKNGWTRTNAAGRDVEFLPYTDEMMLSFNTWQDKQDRPGTNTR